MNPAIVAAVLCVYYRNVTRTKSFGVRFISIMIYRGFGGNVIVDAKMLMCQFERDVVLFVI